jgi:hypothetical protein
MTDFLRSVSSENIESPQPVFLFQDTAASSNPVAVSASGGLLYYIVCDNSLNNIPVFIELYDAVVGAVSVPSSAANLVVFCPPGVFTPVRQTGVSANGLSITTAGYDYAPIAGSSVVTSSYLTSASVGIVFNTAITAVCVVDISGAVSAPNPVSLTVCYS